MSSSFYQNRDCEYFPCHDVADTEDYNCKFCFCPLYTLGSACGGDFRYTEDGTKDCSLCTMPHGRDGYDYILSKYSELSRLAEINK